MFDGNDKELKLKQQRASVYNAGTKHEQNQVKLDQAMVQKQEAVKSKLAQGTMYMYFAL